MERVGGWESAELDCVCSLLSMLEAEGVGAVSLDEARRAFGSDCERSVDGLEACPSTPSGLVESTNLGYSLRMISYCSLTNAPFRSTSVKEVEHVSSLRLARGMEKSRGKERVSSGGAMSIAATRDCSHLTKVSILKHEMRNWSVSARTRITYFFL